MQRVALALAASLALAVPAARADYLPTGTWAVNVNDTKGQLIITEVARDGKVKAQLLGREVTGHWNGKALTLYSGEELEGYLLSEPGEKGKTKYTLTGVCKELRNPVPPGIGKPAPAPRVTGGWYAQMTADPPAGEIKAEVRGVLVMDGTRVYVSVKRQSGSSVEETRVWVWASEGEWKVLRDTLPPLKGKEVIATGKIAQMSGKGTSIPEGALYFLGGFDIKPTEAPKE